MSPLTLTPTAVAGKVRVTIKTPQPLAVSVGTLTPDDAETLGLMFLRAADEAKQQRAAQDARARHG